jgi:DNA-binding MarR family transcriptional regulator
MDWGFFDNPFQTTVLPPNKLGQRLLVGRDRELAALKRRLLNPPKMPTLEGLNGVGKSSLVNVASFECYVEFLKDPDRPMLLPCRKLFQLSPDMDIDIFISDVYREVVQTLIEQAKHIEGDHINVDESKEKLNKWLNSPQSKAFQAGVGGVSGGYSTQTNTGEGFTRSGFIKAAREWLEELFPNPQDGAVVCVVDNLELLQTSDSAKKQLEALRDELLNVPGLRWVLCGALGIVLGVASSPRLEGFLTTPIEVGGVNEAFITDIFNSRLEVFAEDSDRSPYLPLVVGDFQRLYRILFYNLRSLLGHIDEYCQWVVDQSDEIPNKEEEKTACFERWLTQTARSAYESATAQLKPRAWRVFEDAIAIDGSFSPSDFEDFQFNSIPAFRPHVKDLEAAGLVVSTQDEGDKRRKTTQITPKGWLVHEWSHRT